MIDKELTKDEKEVIYGVWYYCGYCFGTFSINDVFKLGKKGCFCPICNKKVDRIDD